MMLSRLLANTTRPRPVLTVTTIFLGAVLTTLQGRLFSSALPDLRGQFGLDVLEGAWLGTALNAAQLVTMPITMWLTTVIGPVRMLCGPSLILGLATFLIPLCAHNYPALVGLHIVTGLCLGIYLPLTMTLALRNVKPQLWLMMMAFYSLRVSTGMDAGMGASGWLVEDVSWHWVYWTASVVGPAIALLSWKAMPLMPIDREGLRNTDWVGMALFCTGLVLGFVGIESAERLGWGDSGLVVSALIGGGILFGSALIRAKFREGAFGDLIGLSNRNVRICLLIACLYGILMAPASLLIPSFIGQMGDLKPMQTGAATLIAFAAYIATIPLAVYFARRLDSRLLIMIGLSLIAITAWQGTHINHDWRVDQFVTMLIMQSTGESIMLIGLIATIVINLNLLHAVAVHAYAPIARVFAPIMAATAMTTWLRIAGDMSRESLRSYVPTGAPLVVDRAASGVAAIAHVVARESQVIAYIDGFHFVFWMGVLSLALAVLLRPSPPNPIAPPIQIPDPAPS